MINILINNKTETWIEILRQWYTYLISVRIIYFRRNWFEETEQRRLVYFAHIFIFKKNNWVRAYLIHVVSITEC